MNIDTTETTQTTVPAIGYIPGYAQVFIVEDSEWDIRDIYFISESEEKCKRFIDEFKDSDIGVIKGRMIICKYELNKFLQ